MKHTHSGFLKDNQTTVKIPSSDLLVGMYVCKLDKEWRDSDFVFQGFIIENNEILKKVQEQCSYVYIDLNKQSIHLPIAVTQQIINKKVKRKKTSRNKPASKSKQASQTNRLIDFFTPNSQADLSPPPKKQLPFEQEINNAQQTHLKISHIVRNLLHETGNYKPIDIDAAKKAVYDCMHSILRNPDAMLLMTRLRHRDRHTWDHSMNVSILATCFGRHLNLRYDELITLGLCGMFHDMGKMRLPSSLLNKQGTYTEAEKKRMQSHTTLGKEILSATPNLAGVVAEVAYSHHERIDGQGYPRALSDQQISPFAKIISVIDMYDAIASSQPFKKNQTHLEAINAILTASGSQLDEKVVYSFIQCIGVYPPGSLVEMNYGEIALVLETNPDKKLLPKVMLISDQNKKKQAGEILDLGAHDYQNQNRFIKTILTSEQIPFDTQSYFKYGVIQKELHIH